MESKGSITRWLFIGLAIFLALQFGSKFFGGDGKTQLQPLTQESRRLPEVRMPEQTCDLRTDRFTAVLSSRGASLKHFQLTTAKYQRKGTPIDLGTTPNMELRQQLRTNLRNEAVLPAGDPDWQIDFDSVDYQLANSDAKSCTFHYQDAKVDIVKQVRVTPRPYELEVELTIKNRDAAKRRHALVVETTAWRTQREVTGGMFRVSPFLTHVECVGIDGKATRLQSNNFEPDDFKKPPFAVGPLNPGDFYQYQGSADVAAVSNAYFSARASA